MPCCSARYLFLGIVFICACTHSPAPTAEVKEQTSSRSHDPIEFELLDAVQTGITFSNTLDFSKLKITLDYINAYNGGGVGVGDINNDGLPDLYFTGNQTGNRLYLNRGNLQFEDITAEAGVACAQNWSTGVTMADVNNDGWLDIYVCNSYHDEPAALRENKLFINQGNTAEGVPTFTESAAAYGVNDPNYSIQAAFLDIDKDGDLDLYVGNHPRFRRQDQAVHERYFQDPVPEFSDRLYRNDGDGRFTDISKSSGVLNYGWTLGLAVADFNADGLMDIHVAVDHFEPDKLYQNNGDGTFTNVIESQFKHTSLSSMGSDAADFNNDGLIDLYCVDMLSQDNYRQKVQMGAMDPQRFWDFVDKGYHYQYMRNQLQLNTGNHSFVEIGQMAGVHQTDWSWAALFADLNNDGWKDIFVTNGYYRDILDKDKLKVMRYDMYAAQQQNQSLVPAALKFTNSLSSTKLKNYCFINNKDLTFADVSASAGLDHLGFSNGASYADLDRDGDLDLIVNNIDDAASIYSNQSRERSQNNYLQIQLAHSQNIQPIGTSVTIHHGAQQQFQQLTYTRGYQSSVEGLLHFGLGAIEQVDKVQVVWPDGRWQEFANVSANQLLTVNYAEAQAVPASDGQAMQTPFFDASAESGIQFDHEENDFDDYKRQVLLPHKLSQFGPAIGVADVDGDGLKDCYIGGPKDQAGVLFLQRQEGGFVSKGSPAFLADAGYEDMGMAFFDLEGDGDMDLYVVSGGNAHAANHEFYQDRLYLNDGTGAFTKSTGSIPNINLSGSCVKPFDYDQDGDMDLFVGGRHMPGRYPMPVSSYLLENDNGRLVNINDYKASGLTNIGMVTDALWTDVNEDGQTDLLVVGEWMPLTVFLQEEGQFEDATESLDLSETVGWWNAIASGDYDNDGDIDYVVGNLGLNYKYQASKEAPFHIYAADFDASGSLDIALGYINETTIFPVRGRQCSSEQCPIIGRRFPTYADFGKASIQEVYGDKLNDALHYAATQFASVMMKNLGRGQFEISPLPNAAQLAPINGIVSEDIDADGHLDLVIGGNLFVSEVETGRADAGTGLFLKGDGQGHFDPIPYTESGLYIDKDVRDIQLLQNTPDSEMLLLVANNDDALQVVQVAK